MQNELISAISIAIYLLTAGILTWRLFGRPDLAEKPFIINKTGTLLLGMIAVILHGFVLYGALFTPLGLNLGIFNAISLITWLIAFTVLLAAFFNPVENIGIFLLPLAAIAILLGNLFPVEHTLVPAVALELKMHIFLSVVAYSLLSIAAVQAMVLSVQDRHLRNRKPGGFIRALPPLQTMETLLFQMIAAGFFVHSLSLVTGMIYLEDMFAQHLAHKTVLSILAWSIFATLLWGRWRFGWRGTTAIRWTIGGFIALVLAYVGSKWVLEILLER